MSDKYFVTHADMLGVADEIRAKSGKSDALTFPEGWKSAIKALSSEEQFKASEYPAYIHPKVLEIANKVAAVRTDESIVFIAMADSHYPADQSGISYSAETIKSAVQANQAAKALTYLLKPDFAAHLGDVGAGAGGTTPDMLKKQISEFLSCFHEARSDLPVFICIGNHDAGIYYHDAQTDGAVHTLSGDWLYKNFTAHSESDDTAIDGEEYGGYCYRDFPGKKLRVIMLNTSEKLVAVQSDVTTFGAQRVWLANALLDLNSKSDAAEWGFIILCHYPADYGATMPLSELLKAYVGGTSFTIADPQTSYYQGDGTNRTVNFSGKNGAKFIAQFHGHIHNFLASRLHSNASGSPVQYDAWRICIPNGEANPYRDNYYGTFGDINFSEDKSYPKTVDTVNGTSFVVNVINPSEEMIYSFCYGAGYDRTVSLKGISYYSVTTSLTGATVSSSATSIKEGDPYTGTVTVNDGYELKSVVITMGGVDITSTAYNESTGAINISEVTGMISITVVAKALPVNLLPLAVDTDGSLYNGGQGYKSGYRLSTTSGGDRELTGAYVSGFIPYTVGDDIKLVNVGNSALDSYGNNSYVMGFYELNATKMSTLLDLTALTPDAEGNITLTSDMIKAAQLSSITASCKYIRLSCSYLGADSAVYVE